MEPSFKFEGGKAIEKALRALGDPKVIRRVSLMGLRKAAEPMRDAAKRKAPRDVGHLEESIKLKPMPKGRSGDSARVLIGIDASVQPPEYKQGKSGKGYRDPGVAGVAPIKEFGAVDRPAEPFMRPAFDQEKGATPGRVAQEIWPPIERAAKRAASKTKG